MKRTALARGESELKRGDGPQRKTPLKQDPETAAAFRERARQAGLSTDPVKLEEFVARGRRGLSARAQKKVNYHARVIKREGPLSPEEWRRQVALAADLRCVVTGVPVRDRDPFDRDFDAHHALSKHELRVRGLQAHVYDPRNGVFVTHDVHWQHEHGGVGAARIAREKLPAAVWEFCSEMDALGPGQWATAMVQREHPAAGERSRSSRLRRAG